MANIIITGGTSYLGKAFSEYFQQQGKDKLLVISRSAKTADIERKEGKDFKSVDGIDLLDQKSLARLSETCNEYFEGPVHVLNCVGYYASQQEFEKTSLVEASRIFDSNYVTVYNTAYALMPYMRSNGGGHFISFSCTSTKYRYPLMAPFSAAKAALECLMGSLANEYAKYGVIANALALSTLDTSYERTVKPHGDYDNWLKLEDIGRTIDNILHGNFHLMNGNTIEFFQYSDSFFNKSYFERIKK